MTIWKSKHKVENISASNAAMKLKLGEHVRDQSKIRGGGGKGWCKHGEGHGFSCKHKMEDQTIWCMSLRGGGGIIFGAKMLGSRSQSTIPLKSQSFFCKYNMEHILYLMAVEYKHGFLMTLGLMSRSSPDSNKQYIVKIECKIYLFNDLNKVM